MNPEPRNETALFFKSISFSNPILDPSTIYQYDAKTSEVQFLRQHLGIFAGTPPAVDDDHGVTVKRRSKTRKLLGESSHRQVPSSRDMTGGKFVRRPGIKKNCRMGGNELPDHVGIRLLE